MNSRDPATQSQWQRILGIELSPVSHREQLVSALGGQLVSVVIGVSCARLVPDAGLAAAAAVGCSIAAMHYLRCIHPPGGATALVVVLGGESVRGLGFGFALSPVLLDALVLLAAAVAFNAVFPWRRYPVFLARRTVQAEAARTINRVAPP